MAARVLTRASTASPAPASKGKAAADTPQGSATRAGFVALIGRPNAGKSTLLNALVGEHLAAVSHKAQTTRHRIPGFRTETGAQFVFVDTPGLLDPAYPLQQAMHDTALAALDGVDAVCWLADQDAPTDREIALLARLGRLPAPRFLVLTKADRLPDSALAARAEAWGSVGEWSGVLRVGSPTGLGLDALLDALRPHLPLQPFFYPADDLTDLNLRFLAGELIREACYAALGEELPYSIHAAVDEWREPLAAGGKTLIRATLYVERESQKGMVIGAGGRQLKEIGSRARQRIEALADGSVYLELRVKVRDRWSRREADLRQFGYRR